MQAALLHYTYITHANIEQHVHMYMQKIKVFKHNFPILYL